MYNLITFGTEITRGVSTGDIAPVKTYFQTFGESAEFNSLEINQTRLYVDAMTYVNGKFKVAIAMCNNIARAWYTARNIP
jgi:mevalonate pyrophosphate decarboxylase